MAVPSTSLARRTTIPALYLTRTSTSMHISLESEMKNLIRDFTRVQPIVILFAKHQRNEVDGVLGQTYRPGYGSLVNVGAKMAIMGGNKEFVTSSLFTPDCTVARFSGGAGFDGTGYMEGLELPSMRCGSETDGEGFVCKREAYQLVMSRKH
ncbi:unnamed protein product [Dovyalis caffra]|uniref:Uncharacterized protein n=1 Tax=Dovyalis caffra TaxID=77055 RepID=A0AAV1R978_9ROSI|nr:unnamed protein product [Dovyalis caffra]